MSDSVAATDTSASAAGLSAEAHHDPKECLKMKPKKSILKNQVSLEQHDALVAIAAASGHSERRGSIKQAAFDEMNVLATHHPSDKDYGHMKIEEPKTPFHYGSDSGDEEERANRGVRRVSLTNHDTLINKSLANQVAERIASGCEKPRLLQQGEDASDEEETEESAEERAHRLEFERKRKSHYDEGKAMQLAKQLLEQDMKEIEQMEQNNVEME